MIFFLHYFTFSILKALAVVNIILLIRFLEGEGYDSFSYKNIYEDIGKTAYIIFRPEQIFKQNSSEKEHIMPARNSLLLAQKENQFFKKKQILSPLERINQVLRSRKQKMR